MQIEVEVIDPPTTPDEILRFSRVTWGVIDGWHRWRGPDPASQELQEFARDNAALAEFLEKDYASVVAYGEDSATFQAVFRVDGGAAWERSCAALSQPLEVLVENERQDGKLLAKMLCAVDSQLARILHQEKPAIVFRQAGGKSEVAALISYWDANSISRRTFCIADSDAKYKGHIDRDSNKLLTEGQRLGIPVWILRKRSIENYVSSRILRLYASIYLEKQDAVEFICDLPWRIRDYYPFKKGLKSGDRSELPDGAKLLFAELTLPDEQSHAIPRLVPTVAAEQDLWPVLDDVVEVGAVEEFVELARQLRRSA